MLCFVLINSVILNCLCVWIRFKHSLTSYESEVLRKRQRKTQFVAFSGKDQDQGGRELTGKISASVGSQMSFKM